jgi:DNA-binding winged helix-turn-helix (wHTH) protein/TolB-like protein
MTRTYRFGLFEFDPESGELRKSGRLVSLERQPGIVLATLVSAAGTVVTRETLRAAVWRDEVHVDFDRGLAYCLSQIRAALDDSADNPRFVQTLPKRGYRFIAPVEATPPAVAPPETIPSPRPVALPPARRSLARWQWLAAAAVLAAVAAWIVVPRQAGRPVVLAVSIFDNETDLPAYDRPVAALSDLVVERLTRLSPGRVGVIGNAAVLRRPRNIRDLKAVAAGVSADYVLLGQLQRQDHGLRFITHFVRLSDGVHLKANRLEAPDGDIAALEAAVVAEFERAVTTHVLGAQRP